MKDKKLNSLKDEALEDEFEKIFQEVLSENDPDLLDDLQDTADDADGDDTQDTDTQTLDNAVALLRENVKRNAGKEGERVSPLRLAVNILKDCDDDRFGDYSLMVRIATTDDVLPSPDRFRCDVYTSDFYPVCSSEPQCEVSRDDNELDYEIDCTHIWMPGVYTLLVSDKENGNSVVKLEFRLDDHLNISYEAAAYVQPCDTYDMLAFCSTSSNDWCRLAPLPGFRQLRRKILDSGRFFIFNEMRKQLNALPLLQNSNYIFCTCNGDITKSLLYNFCSQMGIRNSLEIVDCSTLYDATCNNPFEHLGEVLYLFGGKVVCLTHLGALLTTGGKTIVKRVLDEIRNSQPDNNLWLCGSRQEVMALMDQFPSFKDFFTSDSWIMQEPYTDFELVQAFFSQLEEEHLEPSDEVKDQVTRAILKGYHHGSLSNWSLSDIRRVIAENIRPRYVQRALDELSFDEVPQLEAADIDTSLFAATADTFEQCMSELNAMVGLDEVKQGVITMANSTRFNLKRRQQGLHTSGNMACHCIFTGNPGTGKTTVARQLGRLYHSMGLLSRGEVIAVDRTRLVGRYIGETEENMKAVLEEARGNVLFIDEAYNLYDGSGDRKDFGARVIDSLLTVLSQPDPDMLIVFAGYEKEMDAMLNTNPGLMGRFPYKYRFADYDADQLMEIAKRLLERDDYILTDEAASVLRASIVMTLSQRTPNFGNARWIEQYIVGGIIPAMANRIAATGSDDYQHVETCDVRSAYERFNPKATELKPRRKVGFSS